MNVTSAHLELVLTEERKGLLGWIINELNNVDFDTIVLCGASGMLVSTVADMLNKNILLVRKERDDTHSDYNIEGTVPARYVLIDDLVASGTTLFRMQDLTRRLVQAYNATAKCVGIVLYHAGEVYLNRENFIDTYRDPKLGFEW